MMQMAELLDLSTMDSRKPCVTTRGQTMSGCQWSVKSSVTSHPATVQCWTQSASVSDGRAVGRHLPYVGLQRGGSVVRAADSRLREPGFQA